MVFISLKKFRIVDLSILIGIGIIAELFCIGVLFRGNSIRPTFIVSSVIILTCLTRWGIRGIISAPILAVVTWLGGRFFLDTKEQASFIMYNWKTLVSMILGYGSMGFTCILYKKYGTLRVCSSYGNVISIALVNSVINITVQTLILFFLSGGNSAAFNLYIYNIIGTLVTIILVAALFSQGIMVNFVEKKKQDIELAVQEAEYEKKYMSELNSEINKKKEL